MSAARQSEVAYLSEDETVRKWLIYNGQVWHIGTMPHETLKEMIMKVTTKPIRTELELDSIPSYRSKRARWYACAELQQKKLLTLYDTRQEAEQALLPTPMPEKKRKSA